MAIVLRKKKYLAAAAASFLTLAALIFYLSSATLDLSGRRPEAVTLIERATGGKAALRDIRVKLLPSPDVRIEGLSLGFGNAVLNIRSARMRLSLLHLIAGRVKVRDLKIDGAELVSENRDNIAALFGRVFPGGPSSGPAVPIPSVESFELRNGRVRFTDRVAGAPVVFDITGIAASLGKTPNGFIYRTSALLLPSGRISATGERRGPSITGRVRAENIGLESFTPYLRLSTAGVGGKADISADYGYGDSGAFIEGRVMYKGLFADLPGAFPLPLRSPSGSASFKLTSNGEGRLKEALTENIKIGMEGFEVNGAVSLKPSNAGVNAYTVDVKLSTTPLPSDRFPGLIPLKALSPDIARKIRAIKPTGGSLRVESMNISGVLKSGKRGLAFKRTPGAFSLAIGLAPDRFNQGAGLEYSGFNETFRDVRGRVSMTDNTLSFSGVSLRYGSGVLNGLTGGIRYAKETASYNISLDASFEAGGTLKTLKELFNGQRNAFTRLIEQATAAGSVALNLKLKGVLDNKTPVIYSGGVRLKGVALTHPDLPVAFNSLDGAASFDTERIVLKGFRAQDGHSDLKVDGHITGYREWGSAEKRTSFNVTAEGWIGRATLLPFIKGSALEDALFKGRILFKGRVHGRPDSVLAEGGLDLTDTDLEYKRLIKKALGYPMTLEGIAGLNRKELIINRMKLGFGESAVGLEGRVFTDRPVYSLSVSSDRLNLSDLDDVSPYLAAGSNSGGFVSFGFNTGRTEQALRPIYEGDIRITDGRFSTPFLARPVEKINAEASIRKNEAHIVIENMSAGKTEVTGRVDIPDIAGRAVNFEFNSPRFFVEDIFKRRPAQGGSAEEKAGIIGLFIKEAGEKDASPDAPPITGAGVIKIKEGGAFGHSIDGLTLEVRLDRDRVYLNPEPFFWNKGLTTGRLVVYREPSSELLFESELGFTDMDLGRLISGLGAKDKLLTGAVNGRVELIGKRAVPTASGINGTASLESENGRLWKFLVMSKIFSIVNIISIDELFTDGLPYKKASGDFYVKDGVISANNLLLDSASLRMSAAGGINLPEGRIDAVMAMHPLVTLDKIITKIPLAGWIIGGRQKSSVSMYYEITGPLQQPDVSPIPIRSIGTGVLGVLQRLIEAPIEAIESIQERKNKP